MYYINTKIKFRCKLFPSQGGNFRKHGWGAMCAKSVRQEHLYKVASSPVSLSGVRLGALGTETLPLGTPPPPEQRGTRAEGVQPVGEGGHGQQRPAMLCQLGARGGARGGGGCPAKRPAKSKCRILSGPT